MSNAEPMGAAARRAAYERQNGSTRLTSAQLRRIGKKTRHGHNAAAHAFGVDPARIRHGWRGASIDTSAAARDIAHEPIRFVLNPVAAVRWSQTALAGLQRRREQRSARRGRG